MKKHIIFLVALFFTVTVFAQEAPECKKKAREDYRQEELKYIENSNILTQEQFEKYSEAYKEYRNNIRKIRQENAIVKAQDGEEITEEQAASNVNAAVNKTIARGELYKSYITKLQRFMTNKQILGIQAAQDKFKREKFRELQNKHGK